jgi:UDP-N-acetylmuramate--alanine ligase
VNKLPVSIFFIGIGGIGVSALAQVAQARGSRVLGSDPNADPTTNPAIARLIAGGAQIFRTHDASNIALDVSLVVATAAVGGDNPEVQEAQRRGIRTVSRAAFLGELMAANGGAKIAVAGTHGKTTTTAMLGVMMQEAGWNPTVFVGAEVAQLGGNVRIGDESAPFVAEACEAYESFLSLAPNVAIITNIEADHLDHYGSFEGVKASFRRFSGQVQVGEHGGIVYCADDAPTRELVGSLPPDLPRYGYGMSENATVQVKNVTFANGTRFNFVWKSERIPVVLNVPGKHNVLNAAAALATAIALGADDAETLKKFAEGLAEFRGAERRQDILADADGVLVIDDYAHHPTEIRATLEAIRAAYSNRRVIAVFQPHLYSRTRDFLDEFAAELSRADALFVTDIYAAREQPIDGVNAEDIVKRATAHNSRMIALFVPDKNVLPPMVRGFVQTGDVVLFMGAGDIRQQGEHLAALLPHPISKIADFVNGESAKHDSAERPQPRNLFRGE